MLLGLALGSGVGSKMRQTLSKMCGRRALAFLMMYEVVFFYLQEEKSWSKKKKRSVWVNPFLLKHQDPTCDTMFTIQHEFLAVSANAKRRLLTVVR